MSPEFAAVVRAVREAEELRRTLRRVRRERDAANNRAVRAQKSRDMWKQRALDHEWALGIRPERKVVA